VTPATVTVTTTADDLTPNDGSVSLREAITAINAGNSLGDPDIIAENPGTFGVNDTIKFNINGSGVQTFGVGGQGNGALPALVKPVTLDGYSQPGASANTLANGDNAKILIELNGAGAGPNADGLLLGPGSGGSTIKGLAVNRFSANGIEIQTSGNTLTGDFVGTNPAGNAAEANQSDGIRIANSSNNIIGGTTPAARNVVSGNQSDGIRVSGTLAAPATGNMIAGNFVGVNAVGTGSVGIKANGGAAGTPGGNGFAGIEISGGNSNTVGGAMAGARNVVGFNAEGIQIDNGGQNNVIQGNFSGVGADGITPVGNNLQGIVLRSSNGFAPPLGPAQPNEPAVSNNNVGGTIAGAGNLVEFNGTGGVAIFGNPVSASGQQNSGNAILGNSIFENGRSNPALLLGIDLSNGFVFPKDDGFTANDSKGHGAPNDPNNFQNFPVLTSVVQVAGGVRIAGTLSQAVSPNTTFRIEFFSNNTDPQGGVAEGETFLGFANQTTAANGQISFSVSLNVVVTPGQLFTADATDPLGNTSEFSPSLTLPLVANPAAFPIGFGVGTNGVENVLNLQTNGAVVASPSPIPGFVGEVHRATGDFNRDGVADTVWAAGPGSSGPRVRVIAGGTGQVLGDFFAFSPSFAGGAFVAVGDVNNDGVPDVIVAAGSGGGPEVKVIDGTKLNQLQAGNQIANTALLADFFAYDPTFAGGVTVAAGDVNGDGRADVITGAGPGGGPHVKVIDATKATQVQANGQIADAALLASFFAFTPSFTGGVFVAAGDVNGDQRADIITGSGAGGTPEVKVVDGTKAAQLQASGQIAATALLTDFFAFDPAFLGGVRVDALDVNGDGLADIIVGAGPGGGPHVKVVNAAKDTQLQANSQIADAALLSSFFATDGTFAGGVFV
jgi:CSLREA domain-containing protein